MIKATITSKGQLTLPKAVRERLGLLAGDMLLFEIEGDSLRLRLLKQKPLKELRGSLPAKRPHPGKAAVRAQVGRKLGERLRDKRSGPGVGE